MDDYHCRKAERIARYRIESGRKLITCGACNGSGYYDHNGNPPCGACDGTGRVREPSAIKLEVSAEISAINKRIFLQGIPARNRLRRSVGL
jgi:DnaJ-class molecular chaperone